MTDRHFIFTYSVSPKEGLADTAAADAVRDAIANIQIFKWDKCSNVETTFVGELKLTKLSLAERRAEAKAIVKKALSEVRDKRDKLHRSIIEVVLMVDTLGEPMSFSIS